MDRGRISVPEHDSSLSTMGTGRGLEIGCVIGLRSRVGLEVVVVELAFKKCNC